MVPKTHVRLVTLQREEKLVNLEQPKNVHVNLMLLNMNIYMMMDKMNNVNNVQSDVLNVIK